MSHRSHFVSSLQSHRVSHPGCKWLPGGVDQLAEFLAVRDLCGPAEAMRASGVAGADLLAWGNASEVQVDVRLTPFAARKVLAARDEFLAS